MSKKCECLSCESVLEHSEEKVTGLCARHLKAIRSGLNVTAICWNCNSIIDIGPKGYKARKVFGTYIPTTLFTKECNNCDNGTSRKGLRWITANLEKSETAFVAPNGILIDLSKTRTVGPSEIKEQGD